MWQTTPVLPGGKMKVLGAFLADEAFDLPGGGMSLVKAGIVRRTVPTAMESFLTNLILLCDIEPGDTGRSHTVRADLIGPDGERIAEHLAEVSFSEPLAFARVPLTIWISPERVGRFVMQVRVGSQEPVEARFELQYADVSI